MMRDPEQTIGNLIDRQNTSFVGSVDEDGYPEVKAMLPPRKREGIRTFYFTSNTSSMRAAHYRAHPQACIYFVDRRFFRGVMLKGTMEVLEDAWANSADFNLKAYLNMMDDMVIRPYSKTTVTWENKANEILKEVYAKDKSMADACREIAEFMDQSLAEE